MAPLGRRCLDSSTALPTRSTAMVRSCAKPWPSCPGRRILADGSGDIVGTIEPSELRHRAARRQQPDRAVPESVVLSDVLDGSRSGLDDPHQAVQRHRRRPAFRRGQPQSDQRTGPTAGQSPRRSSTIARTWRISAQRSECVRQRLQLYNPDSGSFVGAFVYRTSRTRCSCCSASVPSRTPPPRTAKLCADYLGLLRLMGFPTCRSREPAAHAVGQPRPIVLAAEPRSRRRRTRSGPAESTHDLGVHRTGGDVPLHRATCRCRWFRRRRPAGLMPPAKRRPRRSDGWPPGAVPPPPVGTPSP